MRPGVIRLESHPNARNQAVANSAIPQGSTIISVKAFTTALLPSQKGLRCDECFKVSSDDCRLKRCQGCASYWYCSTECQLSQWNTHHKKICKNYSSFTTSNEYQSLQLHQKMDAVLLAHFIARYQHPVTPARGSLEASDEAIFLDLLPGPDLGFFPPIPRLKSSVSSQRAREIYMRFGNNNFTIHTHFDSVGHGVFPFASRLFNHSCLPNAAAKYHFNKGWPVLMEVIALRDILADEQVCIPYVDPALTQTREKIFEFTYGFRCDCGSCRRLRDFGPLPPPPKDAAQIDSINSQLRAHVSVDELISSRSMIGPGLEGLPREIVCVLGETFTTSLSEAFSKASHDGQYESALDAGITLAALYLLIYPPNYPQIGLHLLELAKVAWNMFISSSAAGSGSGKLQVKEKASDFLHLSRQILELLGLEGDEGGPFQEIESLSFLLLAE